VLGSGKIFDGSRHVCRLWMNIDGRAGIWEELTLDVDGACIECMGLLLVMVLLQMGMLLR
jgi:hypothetical protein